MRNRTNGFLNRLKKTMSMTDSWLKGNKKTKNRINGFLNRLKRIVNTIGS